MSRVDWVGVLIVLGLTGSCMQDNYYKHVEKHCVCEGR